MKNKAFIGQYYSNPTMAQLRADKLTRDRKTKYVVAVVSGSAEDEYFVISHGQLREFNNKVKV